MRGVVVSAGLALLLGGCLYRDRAVTAMTVTASGSWRIERQEDRITGGPVSSAFLLSRQASSSTVPILQQAPPAMLQLTCFKGDPIVRLAFEVTVGTNTNTQLGYRFDDKPGHEADARFLVDRKTVVIEDKAAAALFASELATSSSLYVLIRSLTGIRTSAEFRVEGAPAALQAGFAGCPVAPAPRTAQRG